ncbi:MAG TPA: flagellar motor protein [Bryobacteraceae bacterium]|nr:flagellar motor protein [Bryobacteraceae bacterium]
MADAEAAKKDAPKKDAPKKKSGGGKPDLATIAGLVLAVGGIMGGLILEGGKAKDVAQVTAAMIVLSGTIGAVMVTTPLHTLMGAVKKMGLVFFERNENPETIIEEIIGYASKARKSGIVSLEHEANGIQDPFLRKALNLAVDGTDLQVIRQIMELEISLEEHHAEAEAKVFESAGGYAPTIGIIGAVLGLIQVMKNLSNIEEVGHGIAVAFVATVYGVGTANLFFLPAGNKIKARMQRVIQNRELMLEGVASIVEGLNPKLIQCKLEAYLTQEHAAKAAKDARTGKAGAKTAKQPQAPAAGAPAAAQS